MDRTKEIVEFLRETKKNSPEAIIAAKEDDRELMLWCNYRLNNTRYNKMLDSQGGVCAICSEKNNREKKMGVDHNHTTGKKRGILCNRCNLLLGRHKENIEKFENLSMIFKNAADYLKKYKEE